MGGVFGGLLALIEVIGGASLYILFGARAWKTDREMPRLVAGAIVVGIAISLFLYLVPLTAEITKLVGSFSIVWWFVVGPLLALLITFTLLAIRRTLD
jgi:hypothetical protein